MLPCCRLSAKPHALQDLTLWRTFDWVLCLEVGEHVPKQQLGRTSGALGKIKQRCYGDTCANRQSPESKAAGIPPRLVLLVSWSHLLLFVSLLQLIWRRRRRLLLLIRRRLPLLRLLLVPPVLLLTTTLPMVRNNCRSSSNNPRKTAVRLSSVVGSFLLDSGCSLGDFVKEKQMQSDPRVEL